jgi:hypothetical protein
MNAYILDLRLCVDTRQDILNINQTMLKQENKSYLIKQLKLLPLSTAFSDHWIRIDLKKEEKLNS